MNKEILEVAESVSNEKSLPREKIFKTLESALEIAIKKKYKKKINIKVYINRKNGIFNVYRIWTIVKNVKYPEKEINIKNIKNKNVKIGEYIKNKIKSIKFDRISTQTAKQVIIQKMKQAEKLMILKKIKKKKGKIISGFIKKINKNYTIIDIGYNLEAILLKEDMILKEKFKKGDKIKGLIYKFKQKNNKYKIFITRSKNNILIELLKLQIPEIKKKIIKIINISRYPGLRSKIAIKSKDKRIDPIGTCIGIKGLRIQKISNQLSGEKIDIILWNKNPKKFVINAMAPAKIINIKKNKINKMMEILVKNDNIAKAIGKKGQNIKLASKLTKWNIHILNNNNKNKNII